MKPIRMLEQTPRSLSKIIANDPSILIPVGNVEWHGDHLPLGVDSLLSVAVCEEISSRIGIPVAPLLACGICRDLQPERGFFGTLDTIREQTLTDVMADLLQGYAKMGFRKAIILSGHFEMEHYSAIIEGMKQVTALQSTFRRPWRKVKPILHARPVPRTLQRRIHPDVPAPHRLVHNRPNLPRPGVG